MAHPGDTEAALAAHEAKPFPRGEHRAAESARDGVPLFRADAPQGRMVDAFAAFDRAATRRRAPGAQPPVTRSTRSLHPFSSRARDSPHWRVRWWTRTGLR